MEALYKVMDDIKEGRIKYSKEERDRVCRNWEICEYTRYHYDKAKLEAAQRKCLEDHTHPNNYMPKKRSGDGLGSGKLQMEKERQRLILEIENI